ncbi:uncharacterized protein LOC117042617 [Lacerta agilis]|uniref:uncharacterized protein LOC117042617 n=1 Tax=Lacerta agilis TaxID=80427 RepID=UPI0014195092|nr:uncharacterized protein LOC117042617 [Lacerta agilis]
MPRIGLPSHRRAGTSQTAEQREEVRAEMSAERTLLLQPQTDMAAAPAHFSQGFFKLCSLFFLVIIWCALLGIGATVKVTQEPLFASTLQKGRRTLNCSHSESSTTYNFFWYRQLPGGKELKHIGSLYEYNEKMTESEGWLSGKWLEKGKKMSLELQAPQPNDTGLYLCAVRDTVKQAGTATGAKPSASIKQPQLLPHAAGILPISHKCSITSHNQWAYWCHHLHQGHTVQGAEQRNSPDVRRVQHCFPQFVYTDAIIYTRVPQPGALQTLL